MSLRRNPGTRVYWPIPKKTNLISFSRFEARANLKSQIFDNYRGTLDVAPDVWVGTYVRSQPLFGRSILWLASLPVGSLDPDSSLPLGATNTCANGIGDLTFGAAVNVPGVPELAVRAYADWSGGALPTEAEWEYAAPGGLEGRPYAWGDIFTPGGVYMANTWQGMFPKTDLGKDGHNGRATVRCFPANGYGLYDMIGNVREWTEDPCYPDKRFQPPKGIQPSVSIPCNPTSPSA